MKTLTISTIDHNIIIILQSNLDIIDSKIIGASNKHAELTLINIENILIKNNIWYDDINCFSVVNGPGSFLGLKVAVSFIKAVLCIYQRIKVITNNVFEIISQNKKYDYILLEAGIDGFYIYDRENDCYFYNKRDVFKVSSKKIILTNSNIIVDFLKSYNTIIGNMNIKSIVNLNYYKYINKIFSNEYIKPLYIRDPQINRKNE